jgi:ATP-dependent 26S proteasome regulatory subunit
LTIWILLWVRDGIFNHNRSKIVITTNQAIDRIDNALVRPGRCFDFLVLNPLTTEQAIKIWVEILDMSATDFFQLYGEAETITQAALMSDCKRLKAALMERRYIKGRDKFYTVEDKLSKHGVAADSRRYAGFSA